MNCKICIVVVIVFISLSCAGPLWDSVERSASSGSSDINIIIDDPLLIYILFYDDYVKSECYGIISFQQWVMDCTGWYDK